MSVSSVHIHFLDIEPIELDPSRISSWYEKMAEAEAFMLSRIALNFCSDEHLLEMNKKHLKHDFYTDIITFDSSRPPVLKGELYISLDRVKENAIENQVVWETELHRVMAHGLLHLMGYGDKSPEEKRVMRGKEEWALGIYSKSE